MTDFPFSSIVSRAVDADPDVGHHGAPPCAAFSLIGAAGKRHPPEKLPPEIRAAGFALLEGYVAGSHPSKQTHLQPSKKRPASGAQDAATQLDTADKEAFFGQFEHDKPADNAKLLAAYEYSRHGSAPFPVDELRSLADDVGITIPGRLDMTLLEAKDKGKKLFARAGRGSFKPTVHGEAYLKATYRVAKGKEKRDAAAE